MRLLFFSFTYYNYGIYYTIRRMKYETNKQDSVL